jgi:hypothetical protein
VNEIFRDLAVMVSEQVIIYFIYGTSGTYPGQEIVFQEGVICMGHIYFMYVIYMSHIHIAYMEHLGHIQDRSWR